MSLSIEDYALVGDLRTCALIGRNGSVDWLCVPRIDSGSVFAALLGDARHGRWRIAPAGDDTDRVHRHYREGTLILETETTTDSGVLRVTDFMPPGCDHPTLVRIVTCAQGRVQVEMDLALRFDYGDTVPWVRRVNGRQLAIAGPNAMVLDTPIATSGRGMATHAAFSLGAGESVPFVLSWQPSHLPLGPEHNADELLAQTETYWTEWIAGCTYDGEWQEPVRRSLITLKALTYEPTGGVVAAATSSLPEALGGERNWDYRYCWLRDTTFTLQVLISSGFHDEAAAWREWLLRAIAGDPAKLQILYGVGGERQIPESVIPWLPGYADSAPVRVGNAAVDQHQLDVYGEVIDALFMARESGLHSGTLHGRGQPGHSRATKDDSWPLQKALLDYLEGSWRAPDEGIWEVRGGQQHFVHSKVMAWVALDRAVRTVRDHNLPGPVERWEAARDEVHAQVLDKGFDHDRNTFTQAYGSSVLDASTLLIPLVGFLPPRDPRVAGTVDAVQKELSVDGFVRRYDTSDTKDGLSGEEGAFLMCTFWLADNLALLGRTVEARELFEKLLSLRNDVGLLAEEYDPRARRMLGNFPQAFSHTALITAAQLLEHPHAAPRRARRH